MDLDMSYKGVMSRQDEIIKKSTRIEYSDYEINKLTFDYEKMMKDTGINLQDIIRIQRETGVGNTPLVIKLAANQLETLPEDSIVRKTRTSFGYEVLVQKDKINAAFRVENTRLEDIILLMVKEGV